MSDVFLEANPAMNSKYDAQVSLEVTADDTEACAALVVAQESVGEVPKDARNEFHGYDYTSAEQMITSARAALTKAGIAVLCCDARLEFREPDGQAVAVMTMEIRSGEVHDYQTWEWPVIESKGRPLDKAWAGALTTATSYFLRGLLLIPRGDTEVDTRDDSQHVPKQRTPAGKYTKEIVAFAMEVAKHPNNVWAQTTDAVLELGEQRITEGDGGKVTSGKMKTWLASTFDALERESARRCNTLSAKELNELHNGEGGGTDG